MIALTLALLPQLAAGDESAYYTVDHLVPPDGVRLEIGGMDFHPDGRLYLSTRRGQVWIVDDPLAEDPADARFHLFAEGLQEGLGLAFLDSELYVVQRGELSKLLDTDGDDRCDEIVTLSSVWGLSGNYHEFAYGLPVDADGHLYVSLNLGFFSPKWWHGKSNATFRGYLLRFDRHGRGIPYAYGFRSPCGIGFDAEQRLLVTDNQGDWMPASPIFHVRRDGFYGHPASLVWTHVFESSQTEVSDTIPPARAADGREPAAVWLPYKWSRSPGNLVPDLTGGAFGPFERQLFVAELTNGMILRCDLEEVQGVTQGAVWPFRTRIGSAVRVDFAPDGTLMAGYTNRGWGGRPPADGIARIRWSGRVPLEMATCRLVPGGGFRIAFTRPLASTLELGPADVSLLQYDYDYWWEYGSPERDVRAVDVVAVELAPDRRSLVLRAPALEAARVARLVLSNVVAEDGEPLLHPEVAYTVNQLLDGPKTSAHVAKIVPPPPARESGEEGWLRLTYGDATDRWEFEGWELVNAELDPDDPTRLVTTPGNAALTNTATESPSDYVSKVALGDARVHMEFMLPAGGETALHLLGRYALALRDHGTPTALGPNDLGGIPAGPGFDGAAPAIDGFRGPGLWHSLDLEFIAPRFGADGAKLSNAMLRAVSLDDVVLHEHVELPAPNVAGVTDELARGPLVVVGTRGPVAIGNVRVYPLAPDEGVVEEGWTSLFAADDSLEGWRTSGDALWTLEDGVLVGEGPMGHLYSPRADYTDVELRARMKIAEGGNSGLYFRVAHADGWPPGYEAQINSSFPDPQKTGSLYALAPVMTHLVPPDTWFDYRVVCRDEAEGVRVRIWVNDVLITDHLDIERRHASGHVALQQHHEGSVIEVSRLEVRELE